ncbi:MAG: hypothetical protein CR982_05530 [Candidatus Cloacimonadota bacterium]|nr:MAG: hypothetical protein CR982_05530 [Candidatus Cloacimonadota bacterium]PIE81416.1 MAG: hypothetical protein CSA15_00840 [Candidatus Delongbacteria bacterium]
MKIAIVSDIHSNLEALLAVLKKIESEKVSKIYCLGDIVGYGPNPNECIDIIRSVSNNVVMGNHDSAVLGQTSTALFNQYAKKSTEVTRKMLSDDNLQYLSTLPLQIKKESMLFTHATPKDPSKWNYLTTLGAAKENFLSFSEDICFIGHSHRSEVFRNHDGRLIINSGSVGQPRDGNSKACFSIFDTETYKFQFLRVEYDLESVYMKIKKSELDNFLGERLFIGK